jgi:GMP synthase-like glutamine amidotransferase
MEDSREYSLSAACPFEGLGSIAAWAEEGQHRVIITRLFAGELLPDPALVDLLVVLGGPMSVHDQYLYPWLVDEKRFLEQVLHRSNPTLGICLGEQLLATVLGARVYGNRHKEIGWFPIGKTEEAGNSRYFSTFPASLPVFHWHGETFDLPAGAVHLARSAVCEHQAFSYGDCVLALQFHLETTPQGIASLLTHCRLLTKRHLTGPVVGG